MSVDKPKILAFLLVLMMTTAAAIFIANQVLSFQAYPFDYDEANHANGALALFLELRAGDLTGFIAEFFNQGFYPPGFSLLKALAYVSFGNSTLTARLFSVTAFFLAMIAIYAVPLEIDERYGWLAGLIGVTLTLTIQPLLVTSAMVMMEMPGLLATFALIWLYLRALKEPTNGRLLAVGLLLVMTFLTKYTYGVMVVGALVLMELSLLFANGDENAPPANGLRDNFASALPRWVWLFGPFLLFLIIWFFLAGNYQGFLSYASAQPPGQPWVTRENLFFYPLTFKNQFLPHPFFVLFSLISLLWAFWRWRNPGVRFLLIYFLVGSLVMTVNLPKNPRFIVTVAPALHTLTGLLIAGAAAKFHSQASWVRSASYLLVALFSIGFIFSLPVLSERYLAYPSLMEVEYETSPRSREMVSWILETIPPGQRFYILNYWDQLSPERFAWHLAEEHIQEWDNPSFEDFLQPAALVKEPTMENISDLRDEILESGVNYLVLFEGGAWGLPFWPEYNQAMNDVLEPLARQDFQVSYYDTEGWQDSELLVRDSWERVKAESRYTLDIAIIVYRVHQSQ